MASVQEELSLPLPMNDSRDAQNQIPFGCAERGLRSYPLKKQFALLHESGVRSLEIGLGTEHLGHLAPRPTEDEFESLEALCNEYAIQTPYVALEENLTTEESTDSEARLATLIDQFQTASRIGATTINLRVTDLPTIDVNDTIWEHFTHQLDRLSKAAQELDLTIALMTQGLVETESADGLFMIETIMTHRPALSRLAETLPPNLGFGYEPAMFKAVNPSDLRYGSDIVAPRTQLCILQEWAPSQRMISPQLTGADDLDFGSILSRLSPDTPLLLAIPESMEPSTAITHAGRYIDRVKSTRNVAVAETAAP